MGTRAYAAACAEFARWAEHGRRVDGAAWEAVVYPLVGVRARPGWARSPLESLPLAGCAALVVPRVVVPPPALAHYGPTWARPAGRATAEAAAALQTRIDAMRTAHPRIDCYGRMHSHPWPHTRPHPSGTDCAEHLTGALASNQAAGLPWALGLIAAAPGPGDPPGAWPIQAYALEPGDRLTDLGRVQVVPDSDTAVRTVLAPAGWARGRGLHLRTTWAGRYAGGGQAFTEAPLHRGWYAMACAAPDGTRRLFAFPPGYPAVSPRRLVLTTAGWQPEQPTTAQQRSARSHAHAPR
jgi:hypothetical protein